jgi:hypothetical protein
MEVPRDVRHWIILPQCWYEAGIHRGDIIAIGFRRKLTIIYHFHIGFLPWTRHIGFLPWTRTEKRRLRITAKVQRRFFKNISR